MYGVAQLFNVLPAEKLRWTEPEGDPRKWLILSVMRLAQSPTKAEWATFFEYSARVKHLHLKTGVMDNVPGKGYCMVDVHLGVLSAVPNTRNIFPCLQTLDLKWEGPSTPLYHLFLSPSLRTFKIKFDIKDDDPFLHGFLEKLGNRSRNITSFKFTNKGYARYVPKLPLEDTVVDISKVTELSAQHIELSLETFDTLGLCGYTQLRLLEIGHATANIDEWFPPGELYFPRLANLVFLSPTGPDLEPIKKLFSRFRCPVLNSLEVQIFGATPTARSFQTFLECVEETCKASSNLSMHKIRVTQKSEDPARQTLQREDMIIRLRYLRPLQVPAFSSLQAIEFDIPSHFSLDDDDFVQTAQAWPELRRLSLGRSSSPSQRPQPSATLSCLSTFATKCPHLQTLNVPFQGVFSADSPWDMPIKSQSPLYALHDINTLLPVFRSVRQQERTLGNPVELGGGRIQDHDWYQQLQEEWSRGLMSKSPIIVDFNFSDSDDDPPGGFFLDGQQGNVPAPAANDDSDEEEEDFVLSSDVSNDSAVEEEADESDGGMEEGDTPGSREASENAESSEDGDVEGSEEELEDDDADGSEEE
ncbi:hypothetical protein BKA70DRAFT_1566885 [Coprinopsis sp. MPI-PUGE-AT-0042]|nr:hypothetical protein BKA70DRAFT_1566885 [Coprinopsis sp. MPI-PUGE-AT-0042]